MIARIIPRLRRHYRNIYVGRIDDRDAAIRNDRIGVRDALYYALSDVTVVALRPRFYHPDQLQVLGWLSQFPL
jgi:hypothetical protein